MGTKTNCFRLEEFKRTPQAGKKKKMTPPLSYELRLPGSVDKIIEPKIRMNECIHIYIYLCVYFHRYLKESGDHILLKCCLVGSSHEQRLLV